MCNLHLKFASMLSRVNILIVPYRTERQTLKLLIYKNYHKCRLGKQ